jgi:rhodanese-related sulfurtransferase
MLSEGVLARLNRDDFVRLVQTELLRSVAPEEARAMMAAGAEIIDVRSAADHTNYSIRGSRNIPLDFLRKARRAFAADKVYVTCSDQEIESAVAAFVLAQQGLEACYLRGTVGEYLQSTGEFGDSGGMSFGEHGEGIIDLPEEYGIEPVGLEVDDRGIAAPAEATEQAVTARPQAPVPAAVDVVVDALRREFRLALEAQQMRHTRDIEALRAEMTALIEGSSRFVIDKLLEKLAALERRMDVPPG